MAGDSSRAKWRERLGFGGRNSARSKTRDGSQYDLIAASATSSQANVVLRPEIATLPTTAAIQRLTDASASLPAAEPSASPDMALHTSPHDTSANTATVNRAADTIEAGLHIVFDSVRDGQPPRVAEIDVVAVHGLNFKGSDNHARDTWTKGDKLWLKDFLPASLPKPARVMLFAYNSSPAINATALELADHAQSLLQWLSLEREASCPALVKATLDKTYKSIVEATCLLVFFATPHQGGKHANFGDIVAKIVRTALQKPKNDLLKALKRSSDEAVKRFEQSRHLSDKCLVVSFFEGQPYGKIGLIVDKKSATLNLPGSREKQVPMDADHSAICKFDSADSLACKLVLRTIAAEVTRALEIARNNYGPDHTLSNEGDHKCLTDLRVTDPHDDKTRIEQDKGGLLRDSYCWVLNHIDYNRWRDERQSQLLWIKGDPGKGKTMLLCGIINELIKSSTRTANIAFFFCQATDKRINNATAVLRGLIYMLVKQQPSLLWHVRKSYDGFGKQRFEDANAWVALSKIFASILEDPCLRNTYLIIDALDECITDLPKLLEFIVDKSSVSSSVKWTVSSRNWPRIEEDLGTVTQKVRLCLELNAECISAAVSTYIQHKVTQLAKKKQYNSDTRSAVQQHLSSNANDTFLWVALVCQGLADVPRSETREKLNEFPAGLDALYERMINQIHSSKKAELSKRILAVVSTVYRPITLDDLMSIVDIPDKVASDYESPTEIIGLCGSFLTLRERTIFFVHQSAKDFLFEKASNEIFPSGILDVHHTIFSRSLRAISGTLRRDIYGLVAPGFPIDQVKQRDPDPLAAARYSCVYWIGHLCDCDPSKNATGDLQDGGSVDKFLRQDYLHWLEALSLLRSMSEGIASMLRLEGLLQVSIH
ncbi:hypothetical protein DL767_010075 [Monosporascus sp. MG133]|nr:hypothetical protein DL767_010075 [Monosporascus sp. MG133]